MKAKRIDYYYLWVGVFFIVVAGAAFSLYYSARQIDYTWRWFRIPQYLAYTEDIEITSEIDGKVETISYEGENASIHSTASPAPNPSAARRPVHQSDKGLLATRCNSHQGSNQGDTRSGHNQPAVL